MKIEYISGLPGLGKTRWSLRRTVRRVKNKRGLTIYVAPTKELLRQFQKDLAKQLSLLSIDAGKHVVRIVSTSRGASRAKVRVSVPEVVMRYLNGRLDLATYRRLPKPTNQTVLLITQETFYRLRPEQMPEDLLKSAHVFFDEAKKSILGKRLILGNLACAKYLDDLCYLTKDKGYYRVTRRLEIDVNKSISDLLKMGLPNGQINNLTTILEYLNSGNAEVYIPQDSFQKRNSLQCVTLPVRAFVGYGGVTLMAAHLEKSQMYHMLKATEGVRLIDKTHTVRRYKERKAEILNRYSRVTIAPLTLQTDTLSLFRLHNYMVPQHRLDIISGRLHDIGATQQHVDRALEYIESGDNVNYDEDVEPTRRAYIELTRKENKVEFNPISWLLKSSVRVKKHFAKRNKINSASLLFVNNAFVEDAEAYLEQFTRVSTYSYGLNRYSKTHIATYLAAINPDLRQTNFMKAFLGPSYDIKDDYTADTCLQCVSRTSIRDTKSKEPVLLIVPDLALAQMLYRDMCERPTLDLRYAKKLGNMAFVTNTKVFTETKESKAAKKKELDDFRRTSQMFKDRNKLYVYRHLQRTDGGTKYTLEELERKLKFIAQCIKDKLTNEEYELRKQEHGLVI